MTSSNVKKLKIATYISSFSMSVVGNLPPILFLTFNSLYEISYSLLGLLVLINFVTQLGIDLIFSFFSHKFNIAALLLCLGCGCGYNFQHPVFAFVRQKQLACSHPCVLTYSLDFGIIFYSGFWKHKATGD